MHTHTQTPSIDWAVMRGMGDGASIGTSDANGLYYMCTIVYIFFFKILLPTFLQRRVICWASCWSCCVCECVCSMLRRNIIFRPTDAFTRAPCTAKYYVPCAERARDLKDATRRRRRRLRKTRARAESARNPPRFYMHIKIHHINLAAHTPVPGHLREAASSMRKGPRRRRRPSHRQSDK